eukprot:1746249-Pyramimonas_sp.AAC.1
MNPQSFTSCSMHTTERLPPWAGSQNLSTQHLNSLGPYSRRFIALRPSPPKSIATVRRGGRPPVGPVATFDGQERAPPRCCSGPPQLVVGVVQPTLGRHS